MADEFKNDQVSPSASGVPLGTTNAAARQRTSSSASSPASSTAPKSYSTSRPVMGAASASSSGAASTASTASSTPSTQDAQSAQGTTPNSIGRKERRGRLSTESPSVAVPKARRMKLSLTKVDPWSVAKVSFLLSIAAGIIQIVAVGIVWWLLSEVGIFDKVNTVISQTGLASGGLDVSSFLGFGQVISWVTIFAVFEVVLVVIIATIGAFLYNVVSALVGGVHVTLGDD